MLFFVFPPNKVTFESGTGKNNTNVGEINSKSKAKMKVKFNRNKKQLKPLSI